MTTGYSGMTILALDLQLFNLSKVRKFSSVPNLQNLLNKCDFSANFRFCVYQVSASGRFTTDSPIQHKVPSSQPQGELSHEENSNSRGRPNHWASVMVTGYKEKQPLKASGSTRTLALVLGSIDTSHLTGEKQLNYVHMQNPTKAIAKQGQRLRFGILPVGGLQNAGSAAERRVETREGIKARIKDVLSCRLKLQDHKITWSISEGRAPLIMVIMVQIALQQGTFHRGSGETRSGVKLLLELCIGGVATILPTPEGWVKKKRQLLLNKS